MTQAPSPSLPERAYRLLIAIGTMLQCPLLLAIRLFWGWQFFIAGKGKLMDIPSTTEFFTKLGIPFPQANVILASSTECLGGLLLIVGLGTRLTCLPLLATMAVAYATADREALLSIWSEPDKFTGATPFLFLYAIVILFAFGPGRLSLDYLIERKWLARSRLP